MIMMDQIQLHIYKCIMTFFYLCKDCSVGVVTSYKMSTTASLADIKDVDKESKQTVFGYIRQEIQPLFPTDYIYYTIPTLIYHWCVLYYRIIECFDLNAYEPSCTLNADKSIITKTATEYGTSYLSRIVHSGVHKWKFKLLSVQGYTLNIGLWKTKYPIETRKFLTQKRKQYAYQASHGCLTDSNPNNGNTYTPDRSYGKYGCCNGDVIDMILDLKERTIRFCVNDKDCGIAYKDIDPEQYRSTIGMYNIEDSL